MSYDNVDITSIEDYLWLLVFQLKIQNKRYSFVVVYYPPNKSDAEFLNYFEEYM